MSKGKMGASASIVDGKFIFVIGGLLDNYTVYNDIEKYDIEGDTWEIIKTNKIIMTPRWLAFSFQINPSSLLIAGGFFINGDYGWEHKKDSYILDISNNNLKKGN